MTTTKRFMYQEMTLANTQWRVTGVKWSMTGLRRGRPAWQHVDKLGGARSKVALGEPASRVQLPIPHLIVAAAATHRDVVSISSSGSQTRHLSQTHHQHLDRVSYVTVPTNATIQQKFKTHSTAKWTQYSYKTLTKLTRLQSTSRPIIIIIIIYNNNNTLTYKAP